MTDSELERTFAFQLKVLADQIAVPWREYVFAAPRRWRFDFAWPDAKVAVEIEGGTHSGGRHVRGSGFQADCEKYAEALALGWRVLRVTGEMVEDGTALRYLERLLAHPSD
jgi:hypothetical protein